VRRNGFHHRAELTHQPNDEDKERHEHQSNTMILETYTLSGHGSDRRVHVVGRPRRVSGGYVVTVAWVSDDETQRLRDGTVHPMHRMGYQWDEPILNIDGYYPYG
jgi:hypothetical protein